MGITAAITAGIESLGVGATAAAIGTTALEGAAFGAATSAISGGNVGMGALTGGLTGGLGGAAGSGLESLGLSPGLATVGGDILGGVATSAIEGKNIGQGALNGLEAGVINTGFGNLAKPFSTGSTSIVGGGSTSAAAQASGGAGSSLAVDPNAVSPSAITPTAGSTGDLGNIAQGAPNISSANLPGDFSSGGTNTVGTGAGGGGLPGNVGGGASTGGSLSDTGGISFQAPTVGGGSSPTAGAPSTGAPKVDIAPANPISIDPSSYSLTPAQLGTAGSAKLSTGGAGGGIGGLLSSPQGALSTLGLVGSLAKGNQMPQGYSTLMGQAGALTGQGAQLQSYLAGGTLPPGLQTGIDSATNAAIATIKSHYASRGMSGSSAEAQDIANATNAAQTQGAQMALNLYSQGVSETNIGDQIYSQLMQVSQQQDAASASAISNFAGALAGMAKAA